FLDRWIEPMDLVDEQDVTLFQVGEERCEIAGLGDHRPRGAAEIHTELARDDLRQRGFAEARRADEQHVIERFLARPRGLDEHRKILARLFLADEFGKLLRPQRGLRRVLVAAIGTHKLASGARRHVSGPRRYLFGNRSLIATTPGDLPFGTITRAF